MTHEAYESKLRSSMHPYPGNEVAIGHAGVYYAWAAREFSAGNKCRHYSGLRHEHCFLSSADFYFILSFSFCRREHQSHVSKYIFIFLPIGHDF